MWCSACREDVPGIASQQGGKLCCARCGQQMERGSRLVQAASLARVSDCGIDLTGHDPVPSEPPLRVDDWEADEELRHVERVLRSTLRPAPRESLPHIPVRRHDPPQPEAFHWHVAHPPAKGGPPARLAAPHDQRRGSSMALLMTSLGLMAFACGAVLLGWSFATGRDDLWSLGMPIMLAGQCGLVLGLVVQLERIWQAGRDQATKLGEVDQRLDDLKQTATLFGEPPGGASHTFYSHLSAGASPQLLLTDLKHQLDLLAVRMSGR